MLQHKPKTKNSGPSSKHKPTGKRGYVSTDRARTIHLGNIKKQSNKARRNMKG